MLKQKICGTTFLAFAFFSQASQVSAAVPFFHPNYVEYQKISLNAKPNGIVSYGKNILFVAVTVPAANKGSKPQAEIQIFERHQQKYHLEDSIPLNDTNVNSLTITPDRSTLVASLETNGIALVDVKQALQGKADPSYVDQSNGGAIAKPGSFQTAITPDGSYAFVANEYGKVSTHATAGNVGVIALSKDSGGRTQGTPLGFIRLLGKTTPGISVSHDGQRVYVVSEVTPEERVNKLSGNSVPDLISDSCVQKNPDAPKPNGVLTVIDVAKATLPSDVNDKSKIISNSVVSNTAAACSPVRVEESDDGSSVWVSARGSNTLLEFNTNNLVNNPGNAFVQAVNSNGIGPVDFDLLKRSHYLMVANADRFADSKGNKVGGPADIDSVNISIFDISTKPATLIQRLPAGAFPRDIDISEHSCRAFVTDFLSENVIALKNIGNLSCFDPD